MDPSELYDESHFRQAVHYCWIGRSKATTKQAERGDALDVGARAGVTSGKHLDPLTSLIADIFVAAGMPRSSIYSNAKLELPGYFRAEKKWDLVVVNEGELIAAIELKSILSSFGNNMNNRTEEALGNAQDLITAHEEGCFPENSRSPWLGYLFVFQSEPRSTTPVAVRRPHFDVDTCRRGPRLMVRQRGGCLGVENYAGQCESKRSTRAAGTGP